MISKSKPFSISIVIFVLFFISALIFSASKFDNTPQQFWVSPNGNDTTGNGSQNNPWQHINYAIQQIGWDSVGVTQRRLNVLPGTYGPSTTGEVFPIEMVNNFWLKGTDSSNTILNAELSNHGISCWQTKDVKISDIKVQNGHINGNANIGGISCKDGAEVEIYKCIVQYCKGGGIYSGNNSSQYADSVTSVYVHNSMIRNNYYYGNGIKVTGGDLTCEYNVFDNNDSEYNTGSAVATIGGGYRRPKVIISNNIIKKGRSNGGAIIVANGNYLIKNNLIIQNTTAGLFNDRGGGGIYIHAVYNDTCIIKENVIVGNTSMTFGGGISILIYSPTPEMDIRIQKNVIAYNTAHEKGGAIGFHNGSKIIIGGEPGLGNDIFNNIGKDSVNLFYHDSPGNEQVMNFQYNFLGDDPSKFPMFIDPDSLFDISNYTDIMSICGVTYDCDSLFYSLGLLSGIDNSHNMGISKEFKLKGNFPNPFNPNTTIEFSILKTEYVNLKIYNLLGQNVATLISEELNSGSYKVDWDASGYSSGIYFYRLETENGVVQSKKLILLK